MQQHCHVYPTMRGPCARLIPQGWSSPTTDTYRVHDHASFICSLFLASCSRRLAPCERPLRYGVARGAFPLRTNRGGPARCWGCKPTTYSQGQGLAFALGATHDDSYKLFEWADPGSCPREPAGSGQAALTHHGGRFLSSLLLLGTLLFRAHSPDQKGGLFSSPQRRPFEGAPSASQSAP